MIQQEWLIDETVALKNNPSVEAPLENQRV